MNKKDQLWTPMELIRVSAEFLAEKGIENARLDAELLLAHILKTDRMQLYIDHARPMIPGELESYREVLRKRGQRVPLQLILGEVHILSESFKVQPGVFIPRADTETLVLSCQDLPIEENAEFTIVEVGCGSGCIGLSLLKYYRQARLIAFDVNPKAIALTQLNAERLEVSNRLELREGDAFASSLPSCLLLVSNPPYVDEAYKASMEVEVLDHDPHDALFADDKGYAVIQQLADAGSKSVLPGGFLIFEHGYEQGEGSRNILKAAGWKDVVTKPDLADRDRVCLGHQA